MNNARSLVTVADLMKNYPGMIQIMTTQTSKYFDFSENISSKTVNLSGKDQQKSMKVKIEKGVAGADFGNNLS